MKQVNSSNIHSIGYISETKTLMVLFKGGGIYNYHDVSAEKHEALMNASSHGAHLNQFIKNSHKFTKQ